MATRRRKAAKRASPPEKRPRGQHPRTRAHGQASREAILTTATKYFAEHGYRGASTASIARAAGLSEPGLLHHFGSKRELLKILLTRRFGFDSAKFREGEALDGLELLPLLETLVRENLGKRDSVKLTLVILAESILPSHPAHRYFRNRYVRARTILRNHLARARRRGFLRADVDPAALATTLLATMDGLQMQWLLDPTIDMARCYAQFTRILMSAVERD